MEHTTSLMHTGGGDEGHALVEGVEGGALCGGGGGGGEGRVERLLALQQRDGHAPHVVRRERHQHCHNTQSHSNHT